MSEMIVGRYYEGSFKQRIYIIGHSSDGGVAYQISSGEVLVVSEEGLSGRFPTLLPESCDGWEWNHPAPQSMGGNIVKTTQSGVMKLWTYRNCAKGDRYVFVADDKGSNDWVEVVFDPSGGWKIFD